MKLRNDPRVQLVERTNARFLEPGSLDGAENSTMLAMDVSFISATLLLGPVFEAAPSLDEAVILVKPQFEAGRDSGQRRHCARSKSARTGHLRKSRLPVRALFDRAGRCRPCPHAPVLFQTVA